MPASSHTAFRPALLLHVVSVFLLLLAGMAATAQDPTEIEFRQALKDMSNDLRLMCVAAHPDDEDGATLAYYRYKYGVKTYALLGTRGEGGQNEIGPELYEDLAVIRTKEMMEAARIEGAELHFLDMPEFGFSKTIEETLEKWGKDVLLEKMVRKIREIRPHVIITHHGRMKDHGHHQAIGWAVQEAFTVAADASAFPESGEPWQVQRLYIRDFTGESKDAVVVDINEKDELRGKTYAEIAADALRAHKSQGMEQFIEMLLSGEAKAVYDLAHSVASKTPASAGRTDLVLIEDRFGPLFENLPYFVNESILGYGSDARHKEILAKEIHDTNFPEKQDDADVSFNKYYGLEAVSLGLNIWASIIIEDPIVVAGQDIPISWYFSQMKYSLTRLGHYPMHPKILLDRGVENLSLSIDEVRIRSLLAEEKVAGDHCLQIDAKWNLPLTVPHKQHSLSPFLFRPLIEFWLSGLTSTLSNPMQVKYVNYIDLAPPVLPEFLDAPHLIRQSKLKSIVVPVRLTNYTPGAHTQEVRFAAPEGWGISLHGPDGQGGPDGLNEHGAPAALAVGPSGPLSPSSPSSRLAFKAEFTQEDEQRSITLLLTAPDAVPAGSYALTAETEGLDFTPEAKVQVAEVALPGGKAIGLIDSYDTTFRDVMSKLDVKQERIAEAGITPDNLDRFETIIVDMRAYAKRPDLKANNAALLDWCKRGGTLIVNYHKTFDWSPDFAPYPISLSNNRVTREDAPVTMLVPEHPWFNTPNKITPEDWEGWRQERGLYFPQKWDDAYIPLIETSDPGEVIPPGSCLIADYGEGKYFYTSLVWYRQLRELHPGALKLFANMLAL